MEHGRSFVAGWFHDNRVVYAGFPHIGYEGVAQIMKPEIHDPCLSASIVETGLD